MTAARDKTPLGRIVEHIGWIISGKGFGGFLSLFYLAIVTRMLGPEEFGRFSLIITCVLLVQLVLSFNVWQILIKYGHVHMAAGDYPALGRIIRFCTLVDLGSALLGICVAAIAIPLAQSQLGMNDALARWTLLYTVAFLLSIRNVPRGILRMLNQYQLIFYGDIVTPIIKFCGVMVAWYFAPTAGVFLMVWALSEFLSTIAFWALSLRASRAAFGRLDSRQPLRAWRENPGLPSLMWAANIGETAYAVVQQLPILLVGSFAGLAEAGLFRLANQLANGLSAVSGFLNLSSYSEMTNVFAKDGQAKLRRLFWQLSRISAGLAVLVFTGIYLLGEPIILLMSGAAFIGAYPFLVILGFAASIQLLCVNCEPLLMAAGRSKTLIAIKVAGTLALVVALLVLLMGYGAIGGAWARAVGEGVTLLLMIWASAQILMRRKT